MSVDVHLSFAPHTGEWTITRSDQPGPPLKVLADQPPTQQDSELPGPSPKRPGHPPELLPSGADRVKKKPSQLPPDLVDPTESTVEAATELLKAMKKL